MKKRISVLLSLILVAAAALTACDALLPLFGEPQGPPSVIQVDEDGVTLVDLSALAGVLAGFEVGSLTEPELEAILYLRESEKLARDVLRELGEQWDEAAFARVSDSENTHTEAVKALIDRYELWDPVSVTSEGQYVNFELYDLHPLLMKEGSSSLAAALKVGLTIQEISILDLREYRAETDDSDVQWVYENLLRASRNHLRVFADLLRGQGEPVERTYLSRTLFEEIVSTPPEQAEELSESGEP